MSCSKTFSVEVLNGGKTEKSMKEKKECLSPKRMKKKYAKCCLKVKLKVILNFKCKYLEKYRY